MNGVLPTVTFDNNEEWAWPWWHFGLRPEDLFTTLHERFNTRTCPIQDPKAFYCDVSDCARSSENVDELYAKLAQRKAQRVRELEDAWADTRRIIIGDLDRLWQCQRCNFLANDGDLVVADSHSDNDNSRMHLKWFANLANTMSFDCMVRYFDGFVRDTRKRQEERSRLRREKRKYYYQLWEEERQQRAMNQEEEGRRRDQEPTDGDACEHRTSDPADSTPAGAGPTNPTPHPTSGSPKPVAAEMPPLPRPNEHHSVSPETASERPAQTPATTPRPHRRAGGQDKTGITTSTTTGKRVRSEEREENTEGGGQPSPPAKRRRVSLPDGDCATACHTPTTADNTGAQSEHQQHLDPAQALTETEAREETHQPSSYSWDAQWPDSPPLPESQMPW